MQLNQIGECFRVPRASREGGFATIDAPLYLEHPFFGVLWRRNVSLTYFRFRRTWTRQEPELSFVIVAKACALHVHTAVEMPDQGSHDGVGKSAHDPT
jgi:hypothetical protein